MAFFQYSCKYVPSWSSCCNFLMSRPHFKGMGMRNLQYEMSIYQNIDNKGTILRFLLNHTLSRKTVFGNTKGSEVARISYYSLRLIDSWDGGTKCGHDRRINKEFCWWALEPKLSSVCFQKLLTECDTRLLS